MHSQLIDLDTDLQYCRMLAGAGQGNEAVAMAVQARNEVEAELRKLASDTRAHNGLWAWLPPGCRSAEIAAARLSRYGASRPRTVLWCFGPFTVAIFSWCVWHGQTLRDSFTQSWAVVAECVCCDWILPGSDRLRTSGSR